LPARDASLGGRSVDSAETRNNLGLLLWKRGRLDEAGAMLREACDIRREALGAQSPELASSLNNLGVVLRDQRKTDDAKAALTEALTIQRSALPATHPDTAVTINNLGSIETLLGNHAEAEKLYRDAADRARQLSTDSVDLARYLNNVGESLRLQGKLAEAAESHRQALAIRRARLESRRKLASPANPEVIESLEQLAVTLRQMNDSAGAEPLYREALVLARQLGPENYPDLDRAVYAVALFVLDQGKIDGPEGAEVLAHEALALGERTRPHDDENIGFQNLLLGRIEMETGRLDAALPRLRRAVQIFRAKFPADSFEIANSESALGGCLLAIGNIAEAEPLILASYPRIKSLRGPAHRRTQQALDRVIALHESKGEADLAAAARREKDAK
jgi:tetratricopeptide (TPR) repeat protein